MILQYDGTFEGFLSLLYEVYYKRLKPTEIIKEEPEKLILEKLIKIKTDKRSCSKVFEALKRDFPKKSFSLILNSFMCDCYDFELALLKYIILGFRDKNKLLNINIQEVFYLQNIEKELFRNLHKMYGFIRFQELDDGTLYAKVENRFNLLYFLGKHFFKRLNNQNFILHDINRKEAFIKVEQKVKIEKVLKFDKPNFSKDEEKFVKLWSRFLNNVTIKSRENKKCQQNLVPLLYRTYMSEFI